MRFAHVRSWGRVLAGAALLIATGLGGASSASATVPGKGTAGYCPDDNGVTVIVDFQGLGGETLIRCAPGKQENGVTALQNAGLELTGAGKYGLAVMCKIEGKPADQACTGMPPENASWSFWTGENGKWASAQVGAQGWKPPAGAFEGWSFAIGKSYTEYPPPRVEPVRKANAPSPAPAAADAGSSSGFPWGVVIGIVVVVVIVAAGTVVAMRRRRASNN